MDKKKIRIHLIPADTSSEMGLPVATSGVSAGFPSPADDFLEPPLDLNRALIRNPAATFFARVAGDSMKDDGIDDGDLLVVDKSLEPCDDCVAVCFLDGEFTLKRVRIGKDKIVLRPANKRYKPIEISRDRDFSVWGVVTYVIKKI
ncbi:translesion error-prone DNA polymerase V autoproteolytic subunit [uncultured Alistipes sp.]|jgi:peptidase S24, S26A and S26B|uniref:LexA family protein n=1 Tax=uncultured Alistipes sp. TaxID=538949 RepID=UPI0025DF1E72|nr:translesion error-prone DNA polymerase V autoproteolytic subunit [uncultured Alistipes sp.]